MLILKRILLRLLTTSITLFGAAVIVFVVIRVVPGNPIAMMLPPGATEDDILRLKALYGFDKSIFEQFIIWLQGVVQGDFGTSISTRQPVAKLVLNRLPATLELSIMALVMALIMGGALALAGTRMRGTKVEAAIDVTNGMALSVGGSLPGQCACTDLTASPSGCATRWITSAWGMNFAIVTRTNFRVASVKGLALPAPSRLDPTLFWRMKSCRGWMCQARHRC